MSNKYRWRKRHGSGERKGKQREGVTNKRLLISMSAANESNENVAAYVIYGWLNNGVAENDSPVQCSQWQHRNMKGENICNVASHVINENKKI